MLPAPQLRTAPHRTAPHTAPHLIAASGTGKMLHDRLALGARHKVGEREGQAGAKGGARVPRKSVALAPGGVEQGGPQARLDQRPKRGGLGLLGGGQPAVQVAHL